MYVMEIGCLLLSVLGVIGAFKGKRWCLILVKRTAVSTLFFFFRETMRFSGFFFLHFHFFYISLRSMRRGWQRPAKPSSLKQRSVTKTFMRCSAHLLCSFIISESGPIVRKCCSLMRWVSPQKRVVREETKLLSMMPLTGTNKANRTLLYSIQQEVSERTLDFCDCWWRFCTI